MRTYSLNSLINFRDLLTAWTFRTIRARYQQSILGGLWAVLQPAATVAVFTIIFSRFVRVDTGGVPYVVFSYTALVPWMLFSNSITDMVESIVTNMNLVSKIYFPREILVFAALLARTLDFGIAILLLFLLMLFYRMPILSTNWVYLPLVLVSQLALSLGLGLAGATVNVFYRDIKHLIALVLQLWLYATPIIYPVSLVPENLLPYYFLNPMAGVIEAYRAILISGTRPANYLINSVIISTIVLLLGYLLFKRLEPKFADIV